MMLLLLLLFLIVFLFLVQLQWLPSFHTLVVHYASFRTAANNILHVTKVVVRR